jgi:ATP-dependent Clp endopeptidase proteolytic subunit ClpP
MKKGQIIINAAKGSDTVDVRLYGIISEWTDVNGNRLADELAKYEGKYKKLNIFLNSNGGSVVEGITIFNILQRTKMEVSIYVDGVAASMASVLLQLPNSKRYMARFTRTMVHRVSGFAAGSADDLRSTAEMMEGFENDLITIIAERTGKTDADIKAEWFDGKDHWFTPQQALDAKLIDGIVDGKIKKDASNMNAVPDLVNFYNEQISNYHQNFETMDLSNLINYLDLKAGSELQEIEDKVKELVNKVKTFETEKKALEDKITDFEAKAQAAKVALVKSLVDDAIKAKKIVEAQRDAYTKLATADYDSAKIALDAMAAPQSLQAFTREDGSPFIPEARKDWSFQDWQKNDGKGLQNLKDKAPEVYQALYDKAFKS